jgi:hypothetical protein
MKKMNFEVNLINYFFEFDWNAKASSSLACEYECMKQMVARIYEKYEYDQDVRVVKEGLVVERKGPAMNDILEPLLVGASCFEMLNELGYDVRLVLYLANDKSMVKRLQSIKNCNEAEDPMLFAMQTRHPTYERLQAIPRESGIYLLDDIDLEDYVDEHKVEKFYTQIANSGIGMVNWKELLSWADKYGLRGAIGIEGNGIEKPAGAGFWG